MGSGWIKSCVGINGVCTTTVYNTPDDGRKLRPKHVEL